VHVLPAGSFAAVPTYIVLWSQGLELTKCWSLACIHHWSPTPSISACLWTKPMARSKLLQISVVFLTYKLRFSKPHVGSESLIPHKVEKNWTWKL